MVALTLPGTRFRLARDTATITANASGTVHAAGWARSAATQPLPTGPANTVSSTAPTAAPPPATMPATAPGAVSPRHQIPSTSIGQKLDAATANASPTTCETSNPDTRS